MPNLGKFLLVHAARAIFSCLVIMLLNLGGGLQMPRQHCGRMPWGCP